MLSFEHKRAILPTFHELTEKPISLERINFVFGASKAPGKIVVREL